jgi:hypothetical protein
MQAPHPKNFYGDINLPERILYSHFLICQSATGFGFCFLIFFAAIH